MTRIENERRIHEALAEKVRLKAQRKAERKPAHPPFDQTVAVGKAQILRDIAAGTVPADVASFSKLHDHVDANYYGDAFDWWGRWAESQEPDANGDVEMVEADCNFWNRVQDALDQWLKAGRP